MWQDTDQPLNVMKCNARKGEAMTIPLHITFRNMKHSAEVEDWIRAEVEKLTTFSNRIVGCRVAVEVPHRHHKKGKPLQIRIDLTLPGREIVVKRGSTGIHVSTVRGRASTPDHALPNPPYSDLELVIHDAFKSAGRRVQDFARRRRGEIKKHQAVLWEARISSI
jgi:predicted oxidoreductase